MRLPILSSIAFACFLATAPTFAGPAFAADEAHLLTVTGLGEMRAAPDQAALSAGVTSTARTAGAALSANARSMNGVFATLKNAGVAEKDIQTSGFSVQPQYSGGNNTPQHITGYQVSNTVTVTVNDLADLGSTLDALVATGANTIDDIAFSIRDPKALMASARAAAVADAIVRAQVLAKAAGVTLGPITAINDGDVSQAPAPRMRAMAGLALDEAPSPIAAGQNVVSASVTITWEIH